LPEASALPKWGTPLPYTATVLTSIKNASAATLGNVPTTKDTSMYLAYPFTTSVQTRIVLSQIFYADSIPRAINLQAKLFAGSGPSATAVTVGGVTAETVELVTDPTNIPTYFWQYFDFPDTLWANDQAYELRFYIWGPDATIAGYDDLAIEYAPCLPAPPAIGSISPTATTLSIPFTAPSVTGGSAVSNYEYSLDNGSTWLTPSPATTSSPLTVTGLTNGQNYTVKMRTITTAGFSAASVGVPATTNSPGSGSTRQVVSIVSPLAPATVPKNRAVSLFGTHFDTVTEVYVGGIRIPIANKTLNRIDIVIPKSLSGALDLELRSPLNNVLSLKHFILGAPSPIGSSATELSVAGFGHNSRKLTPAMKLGIEKWFEQNPTLLTLTCMGFTSLPKRSTDVALSTKRGTTVCNYAKRVRPELKITVSTGIEDPRPGSKIRRALLVLTT
jgi:hypothetical protein